MARNYINISNNSSKNKEKTCFVPSCPNTEQNSPDKLFAPVNNSLKESWCRKLNIKCLRYVYYCCEDHFNPQEDLENYVYCRLMNGKPKLKPTAVLRLDTCEPGVTTDPVTTDPVTTDPVTTDPLADVVKTETIEPEHSQADPYCELTNVEPKLEPIDLDLPCEESSGTADQVAVATRPDTTQYLKTLESFKVKLYNGVKIIERHQPAQPARALNNINVKQFKPRILRKPEKSQPVLVFKQATSTASTHYTSELSKPLLSEDTMPKSTLKHASAIRPKMKSVGVQCRVDTRNVCVGFNGRKNLPIGFKQTKSSAPTVAKYKGTTEPCSCCLRRPSSKDLKTWYTDDDGTEMYAEMLEECLGIQLTSEECGICEMCVSRLRDARDFKLQVQRSQAGLRARLGGALHGTDEVLSAGSDMEIDWLDEDAEMLGQQLVPSLTEETPAIIVRSDGLYECPTCYKTFKREAGLKSHMLVHDQQLTQERILDSSEGDEDCDDKFYRCGECGMEFSNKLTYTKHVERHELYKPYSCKVRDETQDTSDKSTDDDTSNKSSEDSAEYTCHYCGREFVLKRTFIKHLWAHESPYQCDICSKGFPDESSFDEHNRKHAGEMYICDACQTKFYDKNRLAVHIALRHMNIKPYSCKVCEKRYKSKNGLELHELGHIEEKPYSCEICEKKFAHELLLSRHELKHKTPFVCETCGKQYSYMRLLDSHRLVHTGEKPFECNICQKQFYTKALLIGHLRTHTGIRPYSCDLCPKKYTTRWYLKVHKQIHRGEKTFCCEICDKKFGTLTLLKAHKFVHTGERPFSCDICGKQFKAKKHVRNHIDTHMERKYYLCQYCPKIYSHKEGFAQHLRKHARGLI